MTQTKLSTLISLSKNLQDIVSETSSITDRLSKATQFCVVEDEDQTKCVYIQRHHDSYIDGKSDAVWFIRKGQQMWHPQSSKYVPLYTNKDSLTHLKMLLTLNDAFKITENFKTC